MAVALVSAVAGCGGGAAKVAGHPPTVTRGSGYAGALATHPHRAPALSLRNYDGHRVDLRGLRGKAVLVTFIYTHCPDVCPLIVGNLHSAQSELGADRAKLRIVAVSADPRGDTQGSVRRFLLAHKMLGRMDYLMGSRRRLEATWKRWGILAQADPKNPNSIEHSGLLYGISGSGRVTTLYPASFKPAEIVHDVPRLAAH